MHTKKLCCIWKIVMWCSIHPSIHVRRIIRPYFVDNSQERVTANGSSLSALKDFWFGCYVPYRLRKPWFYMSSLVRKLFPKICPGMWFLVIWFISVVLCKVEGLLNNPRTIEDWRRKNHQECYSWNN